MCVPVPGEERGDTDLAGRPSSPGFTPTSLVPPTLPGSLGQVLGPGLPTSSL